ncbi:MAG TPA: MFS transporter [Acidimicrobiales bacterium]|nr:MFS transporter [Acidimicrobiales bacterium]
MSWPVSDSAKVLTAQGVRAFAYGFGAVLLGTSLDDRHVPGWQVGLVLGAVVAGAALMSVLLARYADRLGRRRSYAGLYVLLGLVGVTFASSGPVWLLTVASLVGVLSTEVIESGPFTSLEQPMLAAVLPTPTQVHGFGLYNAVAAAAGSFGALAAALPGVLGGAHESRWFLLFVPVAVVGTVVARSLSAAVEPTGAAADRGRLEHSRSVVVRLASLFALDSFGGGFTVSAFVAYWLRVRFDASPTTIGLTFFAMGLLQTVSFVVAPRLADRFGLLRTMVFTHLPSNLLLAAVAFAPTLGAAIVLLLARTVLSQMDVPTRQTYVMALVEPAERTAAAAYTNTARYVARPVGPPLAAVAQQIAVGLPFVISGGIKTAYDLTLWRWFRRVPLPGPLAEVPA